MKGILKLPLIVAAVVTVARVVAEQMGAPDKVTNWISVVALYMLVFPIYFAVRIVRSDVAKPYLTHLKLTVLYAVFCRLMIAPTYWLAYLLNWQAGRFYGLAEGTAFSAFVNPFQLLVMWVAAATVIAGGMGFLIIALMRWKKAS